MAPSTGRDRLVSGLIATVVATGGFARAWRATLVLEAFLLGCQFSAAASFGKLLKASSAVLLRLYDAQQATQQLCHGAEEVLGQCTWMAGNRNWQRLLHWYVMCCIVINAGVLLVGARIPAGGHMALLAPQVLHPLLEIMTILHRGPFGTTSEKLPDDIVSACKQHVTALGGANAGKVLDSFPLLQEFLSHVFDTWLNTPQREVEERLSRDPTALGGQGG